MYILTTHLSISITCSPQHIHPHTHTGLVDQCAGAEGIWTLMSDLSDTRVGVVASRVTGLESVSTSLEAAKQEYLSQQAAGGGTHAVPQVQSLMASARVRVDGIVAVAGHGGYCYAGK